MEITREQLGNILSGLMPTRTMHHKVTDQDKEITDNWIVSFLDIDINGILVIYCEPPTFQ